MGRAVRQILLDPGHSDMVPECELLLFLADRIQHLSETIRPALQRGEVVICDRFHDATVAYQQYGRGVDFSAIMPLISRYIRPQPDVTLWLDIDVGQAIVRTMPRHGDVVGGIRKAVPPDDERGAVEPRQESEFAAIQLRLPIELVESRLDLEHRAFHQRVREGYRKIAQAEPERVERVDGSPSAAQVREEIWARLLRRYRP